MAKKNLQTILDDADRKLSAAEVYALRPRRWVMYTAIVLILVMLATNNPTLSGFFSRLFGRFRKSQKGDAAR